MNTVLTQVLKEFVSESWYFPQIRVVDAVEILIITFLFYQISRLPHHGMDKEYKSLDAAEGDSGCCIVYSGGCIF